MPPNQPSHTPINTTLAELEGDGTMSAELTIRLQAAAANLPGLDCLDAISNSLELITTRIATLAVLFDRALSAAPTRPQHLVEEVAKLHQLYMGSTPSPDGEPSVGSIQWLFAQIGQLYHSANTPPTAKIFEFPSSSKLH